MQTEYSSYGDIETNIKQVLKKFLTRTYAVGIPRATAREFVNLADHTRKKADGLNRVSGKSKETTYGQLWKKLDEYYDMVEITYKIGNRVKLFRALVREANGGSIRSTDNTVLRILTDLINSKKFGNHSEAWAEMKGFMFNMKDTGSFFKRLRVWRLRNVNE
jgi:hypothetical protein